jgi:hypothetical protein
VGVEKPVFLQNIENLEDGECLGKSRTSFVEHPDAILFLRISGEGVFQQPRDFSTTCKGSEKDCWTTEQTDFTKRLDMTTISRALPPSHFTWSVGGVS